MYFIKFGAIITFSFLLVMIIGCRNTQGGKGQQSQLEKTEKISAYGISLTRESSPKEVANLLIKGLDNDDKNILSKLVAVKYEMKEIEKIFHKYGKKANVTPEKTATITVLGWMATYAFFEKGQTTITEEKIEGDKSYVYAIGQKPNGAKRTLEIRMIREDGWWKIQAGLREY